MNEPLPYEILIADKLDALPIPDMADAIWGRISKQLDIDLPTDDGPPDPPTGPANLWKGFGFSIILIAVVTLLIQITNKPSASDTTIPVQPATISEPREQGRDPATVPSSKNSSTVMPSPPRVVKADTTFRQPQIDSTTLNPDSVTHLAPAITLPVDNPVTLRDTIPKKPRGVPGIGKDDYRIEPAKKND